MRLHTSVLAVTLAVVSVLGGCVTYSRDLQRVRDHYRDSEFPQALALLRVLGDDLDALSPRERVEYAYLRGMTDFRLSEAAPAGATRESFRSYAQTLLTLASELDRKTPVALSEEQRTRMNDTLTALKNGTE
jgi:hypothetical protein